ncbi:sensor domain-containing protein [Bacillus cereus group sp. MYBK163-2]|uniref:sensor domain-containing protein n=1 Tax=Bacillus cereus group sp. MYBK163-2 TaxID=3450675 RepID=UPI003F7B3094
MTKEYVQKSLQDFYFFFYLVSITCALVLTVIFIGMPLLGWVLQTTHKFVQYERIQTKVYTGISIEPILPMTKNERDKWIKAREAILNSSNWRAIFWLMQKSFVGVISLICAVILYVAPFAFTLTTLLFQYFDIYLLGIVVNSWQKAIVVMIVGCILIWICICIGNSLVRTIGMYTRSMFKAIKE